MSCMPQFSFLLEESGEAEEATKEAENLVQADRSPIDKGANDQKDCAKDTTGLEKACRGANSSGVLNDTERPECCEETIPKDSGTSGSFLFNFFSCVLRNRKSLFTKVFLTS